MRKSARCARREQSRARDRERLMLVAGTLDRRARAGQQHVVEVRIEARLNQQDGRHFRHPL